MVRLDGAVESAVRLGVADAVADVVETGTTLKRQGLEIFGPVILESTALLIASKDDVPGIETLRRRLQGVMVAHQYVLMDYDLPADLVDAASRSRRGSSRRPSRRCATRLGGRAGHGAAHRDAPPDGRSVRARRTGHPGELDPRRAASEAPWQ